MFCFFQIVCNYLTGLSYIFEKTSKEINTTFINSFDNTICENILQNEDIL